MSHHKDDHPACRDCCRAAGDRSAPCRRAALLGLDPGAAETAPPVSVPKAGRRPGDAAGRAAVAAPVP